MSNRVYAEKHCETFASLFSALKKMIRIGEDERSVATEDDSSNKADITKKNRTK